jgi:hypothetical protein
MSFFRSYIAPLLIVLIFAIAMLAVSARIFLSSDMQAPAPIEAPGAALQPVPTVPQTAPAPALSELIHGPAEFSIEG